MQKLIQDQIRLLADLAEKNRELAQFFCNEGQIFEVRRFVNEVIKCEYKIRDLTKQYLGRDH